jgi:hypothetical protein
MKAKNSVASARSYGIYAIGLLAVVLLGMFWRSFLPDFVHFSNDGPLGQQNAAWIQMPDSVTGMWADLNYLGGNAGTWTLSVTAILHYILAPVTFAKYYPILTLFLLGVGAWTFFRQLKLSPFAAALGALATVLNSTFFSTACWGVASQEIALGMAFFALALIVGCRAQTSIAVRWARLALAGFCVGINVMEAADIGALLSMLVALFVFFQALSESEGTSLRKAVRAVSRVAVVALFALFIAIQSVLALVGGNIQGVAGTAQDTETKAAQWDWATQWSLPKIETAGLLIPGLFGYKMDTPKDMMPAFQNAYRNGVYWGGVGRAPELDRYFDGGSKGPQPSNPGDYMRFTGGGNYCGILVFLVAGWAIAQSFRRKNSVFDYATRRMIWFWLGVMILCLLFAWGRFASFYAILYHLPYFSTIRNPAKFIIVFSFALVCIFAYGLDALGRTYLDSTAAKAGGIRMHFKKWWPEAGVFDRGWFYAAWGIVGATLLGWLIYVAQKPAMIAYLQKVGFPDADPTHDNSAPAIMAFSYGQVGWFFLLLAIGVGILLLVTSGFFAGPRAKLGAVLLGSFLVFDMCRANLPWVIHWDYKQKYEVGALNSILKFLQDKPYENRVADLPFRIPQELALFEQLYRVEWLQHHFPFYNIQSLDIVQMPRMPEDIKAYKMALAPSGDMASVPLIAREWQLTSTRYLLGPTFFYQVLNEQLDPVDHRFRILQRFDVLPKPGVSTNYDISPKQLAGYLPLEQLTAVPNTKDGDYALFEFTGALPRAKVYGAWQVNTNDQAVLKTLGDLKFDPVRTVLVSTPEQDLPPAANNENSGSVEYQSYSSKHIVLSAEAKGPSVLLLNDKYDPHWTVTVDGKPAEVLRCNFIMRGVYLPTAGQHTVDFSFTLPHQQLYITIAAFAVGIGLCGFLVYSRRRTTAAAA